MTPAPALVVRGPRGRAYTVSLTAEERWYERFSGGRAALVHALKFGRVVATGTRRGDGMPLEAVWYEPDGALFIVATIGQNRLVMTVRTGFNLPAKLADALAVWRHRTGLCGPVGPRAKRLRHKPAGKPVNKRMLRRCCLTFRGADEPHAADCPGDLGPWRLCCRSRRAQPHATDCPKAASKTPSA